MSLESDLLAMAGDDGVGVFQPTIVYPADFPRVREDLLEQVRHLAGAATTGSDVLDELALALAVPRDELNRRTGSAVVAGHVLTMSYVPERRSLAHVDIRRSPSRLAHNTLFEMAHPGDIVVIDARGSAAVSVLGGMAAAQARRLGITACIVDGGVRDINEIVDAGLSVWARSVTPRTGKWRLEAFGLNLPIVCGGVQVHAGDVAIADDTGVCFFPAALAETGLSRILDITTRETMGRK
jgi:regulator of RNase E activity RraA